MKCHYPYKEKEFIKDTFGKSSGPDSKRLFTERQPSIRAGRQDVSVLFVDIRGIYHNLRKIPSSRCSELASINTSNKMSICIAEEKA